MNKSEKIRELLKRNVPDAEITKRLKIKGSLVSVVKWDMRRKGLLPKAAPVKVKRKKLLKKVSRKKLLNELQPGLNALFGLEYEKKKAAAPDLVNSPPHYEVGGISTIDFIEAKQLNYRLGNVVKYASRAQFKGDKLQDLEKAAWYLNREIEVTRKGA